MSPAVEAFLASLPEDRRAALSALRNAINAGLPEGYEEGIQYGNIAWYVPHSLFPDGYHCDPKQPLPFASIAATKSHYAVHLFCIYSDAPLTEWFVGEYRKTGKKLDMGKACVRFKKMEDAPLELFGRTVAKIPVDAYVARYQANIPASAKKKAKAKK